MAKQILISNGMIIRARLYETKNSDLRGSVRFVDKRLYIGGSCVDPSRVVGVAEIDDDGLPRCRTCGDAFVDKVSCEKGMQSPLRCPRCLSPTLESLRGSPCSRTEYRHDDNSPERRRRRLADEARYLRGEA